jgi:hypothetical protein
MDELIIVLNRERQVLEHLLFRLLGTRGLLTTGDARFLGWAANDLAQAAEAVREVELRRATVVAEESDVEGGHDGSPTLKRIIAATHEPYASLLEDHRVALGRLAVEIGALTEATQELAAEGLRQLRARETAMAGTVIDTEAPPGRELTTRRDAHLPIQQRNHRAEEALDDLDREILAAGYEAVVTASGRLILPSLVAFLG